MAERARLGRSGVGRLRRVGMFRRDGEVWSCGGRAGWLLVTPLIRPLRKVCGTNRYPEHLDRLRYALAGEFSFAVILTRTRAR